MDCLCGLHAMSQTPQTIILIIHFDTFIYIFIQCNTVSSYLILAQLITSICQTIFLFNNMCNISA